MVVVSTYQVMTVMETMKELSQMKIIIQVWIIIFMKTTISMLIWMNISKICFNNT